LDEPAIFFDHAIALSAGFDAPLEWAKVLVTKTLGPQVAPELIAARLVRSRMSLEAAFARAQVGDQLLRDRVEALRPVEGQRRDALRGVVEHGAGRDQSDLDQRPDFIKVLNPPAGRVPVLEEGSFVLPESPVIMEYLEERFPEPSLLPADPESRALARLLVFRFGDYLGDPYYDLYFDRPAGSADRLHEALAGLGVERQAVDCRDLAAKLNPMFQVWLP